MDIKEQRKKYRFRRGKRRKYNRIFYSLFAFNTFKELIDLSKNGAKEGRKFTIWEFFHKYLINLKI